MRWELLQPNINRIISIISENPSHFLDNWWSTFSVSASASLIAIFASIIVAVFALRLKLIEIAIAPTVALSQSFPLQAIAPIIIIVMGIGFHTKTSIAFIIAFFPMYGACITALKTTSPPILAYLAVCRAPFWKGIRYCRIPAALPAIISAAKIGFTLAVLGAVVAEFIQPDKGLGYLILVAQSNYDIDVIYICVLMLIIQGVTVYGTLSLIENRLISKRRI